MKNHPRDDSENPEDEEPGMQMQASESAAQEDRRLEAFRARCARMRENTERELARLAERHANVRAQIGISSDTMEQWKQEHQQMMRDGNPQSS